MKKLLLLIPISLLFTSCGLFGDAKESADNLKNDLLNSYENITDEVDRVKTDYSEKKEQFDSTSKQVKDTYNSIKGAVDAIKSIGDEEDSEETSDQESSE